MRIGVPRELKEAEDRVGLIPGACGDLIRAGHEVFVEAGSGLGSGFSDDEFEAAGVVLIEDVVDLYAAAELIVKVKEPIEKEWSNLRSNHLLFCFLHLAANEQLTQALRGIGLTAIAFETVSESDGSLPLLAPMSAIAGRLAIQIGSNLLHAPQGGKGLLLGGIAAAERGRVVVMGAGSAGSNAVALASAVGATVTVFDLNSQRLERMRSYGNNVTALYPYNDQIRAALADADLLVGAVLIPGARAPVVVDKDMIDLMGPGSVSIDISVDQGGCIETTRPTNYLDPTYVLHEVVHCNITNMPGAVPRTASQALSAVITPYVRRLASPDWREDQILQAAINIEAGGISHPALKAG